MQLTKESEDLLAALRSDATAVVHTALAPTVSTAHVVRKAVSTSAVHLDPPLPKSACFAERRCCTAARAGAGLAQQSQRRSGSSYSPPGNLLNMMPHEYIVMAQGTC